MDLRLKCSLFTSLRKFFKFKNNNKAFYIQTQHSFLVSLSLWSDSIEDIIMYKIDNGNRKLVAQLIYKTVVNVFLILHCWYYRTEQAYCTQYIVHYHQQVREPIQAMLLFAAVIINSVFMLWDIFHENVLPRHMRIFLCTIKTRFDCILCLLAYWKSFVDNILQSPANGT